MAKPIHQHTARIGQALSSPTRVRALNLLAQRAWSVKELAAELKASLALTSAHLKTLRECHLVRHAKVGRELWCVVSDLEVLALISSLNQAAVTLLPEMRELAARSREDPHLLKDVNLEEFYQQLMQDAFHLVDLRPRKEFDLDRLPKAVSYPARELDTLDLSPLRDGRSVVAYCRGPWCDMAIRGVRRLNEERIETSRLAAGIIDWKLHRLPLG